MRTFKRHIILVFSLCFISLAINAQDKTSSKKGNFEKETFTTNATRSQSDMIKQAGPPGPGGGTGGNPIPINGGLSLLIIGSAFFWGRKIKKELKNE